MTECHRLSTSSECGCFLKREDLTHTGSHKLNNVIGQALLARRMGKSAVSSQRPVPDNTVSPLRRPPHCSVSSAPCTWARSTSSARH